MAARSRKKNNFGLKLLLTAIVLAVVAFFVASSLRPVAHVVVVGHGKAVNSVPGSVVVAATRIAQLTSEIGGRIIKNDLDPGKIVHEGDVLVVIDPGDIDLDIEKIQNDITAGEKKVKTGSAGQFEYETAKENLVTAQRQHDRGAISDLDFKLKERAVAASKQKLELEDVTNEQTNATLKNLLKVKQRQREKMTITAPFDGVVAAVFAHKDDFLGPNATIATLITTTRNVEAKISEENFALVQIGQRAVVRFLTYGDDRYDATVIKKLPTAEVGTQRYVAYLDVKIPPEKLLPDLTGEVQIIVAERETQTQIPRRAFADGYVLVVENGRVQRRKVTLGYTSMNLAEVATGLKGGDQVIVDELDQFHDGDRVKTELVK